MENLKNKTIFISPLDWGFGHSTRCVPIIYKLLKTNKVIIGITDVNKQFFELHFPDLQKINVPSYGIKYSKRLPVWLKILSQFSKIKAVIRQEQKLLEKILIENSIDVVISDNRFGLYNKQTENIFITHQLKIVAPFFSEYATKINLKYIHNFSRVWVPDHKNQSDRLSGKLSDSADITIPVEYIGPQSALSIYDLNTPPIERSDYLILLSGVEPQRTILENNLLDKFKFSNKKITLVRGSETEIKLENKNIAVINFAYGAELKNLILNAETIICRSGYSTLMDLNFLKKEKLILIPTPGQTEQEYLAQYWKEKFKAKGFLQDQITQFT
jgi:uncharacterized protein (TIGR00661 family)